MGVVEIFTKLTLDDQASKTMGHIKDGFKEIEASEAHAAKGAGFFQQTLATIVGMNFTGAIHKIVEFGKSFVEAAADGDKFLKTNAALINAVDGISFDKATREVEGFAARLDEIGVASGQLSDDVEAAFTALNEITGAGAEGMSANVKVVDDMSQVARVLGKDVGWLTQQFGIMAETGMVRAKSQLFLLLKSIGIFQGETKQAAADFGKLVEEDRVRLLTEGIGKLADKSRTIPMGFSGYVKSIKDVIDLTKEDVGMPILKALGPVMKQMLTVLKEMRPMIGQLGDELAQGVVAMMTQFTTWMKDTLQYLVTHRIEITQAIENAVAKIKAVFDFILAHKEVIGGMFAAKQFGPGAVSGVGAIASGAAKAGSALVGVSGAGSTAAFIGGIGGLAAAIIPATAAVISWSKAIDQWNKLQAIDSDYVWVEDAKARKEYLQSLIEGGGGFTKLTQEQLEANAEIARKFEEGAGDIGMSERQAREFTDAALGAVEANQRLIDSVDEASRYFDGLAEAQSAVSMTGLGPLNDVAEVMQGLGDAFTIASKNANVGMQQHIATVLAGSRNMQIAFLESAKLTNEGYAALAEMLPESAAEFKRELEAKASGVSTSGGKDKSPSINFNGGQTFKIQQDFRDQDPDRIAVLFRRDILSSAERRVQASTGSPFGT
jgi:hypothetical protein